MGGRPNKCSPPTLLEPQCTVLQCGVISHFFDQFCVIPRKKNCFLSFGYPDFKISPVSCQIKTGIGLRVSDMSERWLISATHHFEGCKINSLSLCQCRWKEWEKVIEMYISLLIMLTSICYVKIFDSRFCKKQSQFSLVSFAAAWSSWQAPI